MKTRPLSLVIAFVIAIFAARARAADPLPSWNNTATKQSIIAFVEKVTAKDSPDYVAPADRIATFDNDGTLWSEQPMYFQLAFALDRVRAMASDHPEWKDKQPFKGVLEGNLTTAIAGGKESLLEIIATTHADITTDEFEQIVTNWISTAKHPKTGLRYTEMVYQPMLELIDYLKAKEFKVFIVSGGGIEFMRPWTQRVYGIPPEQVIGSSIQSKYELRDEKPSLVRLAALNFFDDKEGKPVAINHHIGRRPIAAFGNSDGDYQMLEWTTSAEGLRFGLIVHHTDADREYAYDRESKIGRLAKGLDDATSKGWIVADMKEDWNRVWVSNALDTNTSDK